jgi:hypothetical protein
MVAPEASSDPAAATLEPRVASERDRLRLLAENAQAPMPPIVAEVFGADSLEGDPSTVVAIDSRGTILWTNAAWDSFARDNGGTLVLERFRPGSSYFEGISGSLRGFYERAFRSALGSGTVFEQEYECSSPDVFRLMHLRALPIPGGALLLEHSLVAERAHEGVSENAIEARYRNGGGMIVQCSNCRRFRRADDTAWDWVRPWVIAMPRNTSHGVCTTCADFYYGRYLRGER